MFREGNKLRTRSVCETHRFDPICFSAQFHQTLLTYMRDKVWDFHFYVANGWPEDAICLHFPGMTLSVSIESVRYSFQITGDRNR